MAWIIISIIALILITILYLISFYLIAKKDDEEKLTNYESGFEPIGENSKMKISILYWIIGILYLIFDLEIIFLFPFASILSSTNSLISLWALYFFLTFLTLGFLYEIKQGALELK